MKAFKIISLSRAVRGLFFSALLTMVLLTGGCYYDNAEDLYPTDTILVQDTGVATYSFSGEVQPIIDNNCATAGCHASGGFRQPLTSYDEVVNGIENFNLRQRVSSGSMPPGGMADGDKEILLGWIDENYPNN